MQFAKKHPPKQLTTTVHQVDTHEHDTMSVASGASSEFSSVSGHGLEEHKAEIAAIRAEYQRELESNVPSAKRDC